MLGEPHVLPLTQYVARLRRQHGQWEFPDFDPFDAGCNAEILFLLEKPGPMTSAIGQGSGFISRDNDDPTAAALFDFMTKAGLARRRTLLWNVIPGWNGTRRVTRQEIRLGVTQAFDLLPLLPKVRTIVLVGKKAQRAKPLFSGSSFRLIESAHPSPIVRATQPDKWDAIPRVWALAS